MNFGMPFAGAEWAMNRAGAKMPGAPSTPLEQFMLQAGDSALTRAYQTNSVNIALGRPAYEVFRESLGNFDPQFASDDELTQLYQSAENPALEGQFQALMMGRQQERAVAQEGYQKQLGGNYEGGVLPSNGYKPNAFTTGFVPGSQPQFGAPGASFSGWGGPQSVGGLGGLGGWGGPFSNKNPWGAS